MAVGVAVAAAYVALRLGIGIGGAAGAYCDDMGLLYDTRLVCYEEAVQEGAVVATGADRLVQYGWNVFAAGLGTLVPFLFEEDGRLRTLASVWSESTTVALLGGSLVCVCAFVGWTFRPRLTLPLLALILGNAVLSFAVFRTRNLLPGVAALNVSAAVGVTFLWAHLRGRWPGVVMLRYSLQAGGAVLVVALAVSWSVSLTGRLEENAQEVGSRYRCKPPGGRPVRSISPVVIQAAKTYYGTASDCRRRRGARRTDQPDGASGAEAVRASQAPAT